MEKSITYRVRGLKDSERAAQVVNVLHSRRGVHQAEADVATGEIWLRYDSEMVPPPRVLDYLRSAGVQPVAPVRPE